MILCCCRRLIRQLQKRVAHLVEERLRRWWHPLRRRRAPALWVSDRDTDQGYQA